MTSSSSSNWPRFLKILLVAGVKFFGEGFFLCLVRNGLRSGNFFSPNSSSDSEDVEVDAADVSDFSKSLEQMQLMFCTHSSSDCVSGGELANPWPSSLSSEKQKRYMFCSTSTGITSCFNQNSWILGRGGLGYVCYYIWSICACLVKCTQHIFLIC